MKLENILVVASRVNIKFIDFNTRQIIQKDKKDAEEVYRSIDIISMNSNVKCVKNKEQLKVFFGGSRKSFVEISLPEYITKLSKTFVCL